MTKSKRIFDHLFFTGPDITILENEIRIQRSLTQIEIWMPIKTMAERKGVSKTTVLNRIESGIYRAQSLFGLIMVTENPEIVEG